MIFVDDDGCPTHQNKKLVKIWIISEFHKEQDLFQTKSFEATILLLISWGYFGPSPHPQWKTSEKTTKYSSGCYIVG